MRDMGWHLDPRISVSIIVTLLSQLAVGIWAFASLNNDVQTLKIRMDRQEVLIEQGRSVAQAQAVQLSRIEENTRTTQQAVERILARLERMQGQ